MSKQPRSHMVIPDVQNRPDVNSDHLTWAGRYAAEKRPDKIICIGDFADLPSLNSYAVGKAESEGKRYSDDIKCARAAMAKLLKPLKPSPTANPRKQYTPELHLTLGNHEHRITREAETNPKLIGTISVDDLGYKEAGWKVYPFLEVARLDGIDYSHYMISGCMGRPVTSAAALLRQRQGSAIMGHVQRHDIAVHPSTQKIAMFCGTFYSHTENYLTPQGNGCKPGVWMLNEVIDGKFDLMFVSLDFLARKYA